MGVKRTVMGVGYMGVGSYRSRVDGVMPKEYIVWRDMIHRCYNPRLRDKYPTYTGCVVHDNWHNFQKFAEWFVSHEFSIKGYQLDKDLLVRGNKIYSAESCCMLPPELNQLIRVDNQKKISAIRSPLVGVTFHRDSGKWQAALSKNGKNIYLGLFERDIDAHFCYVREKESFVHEQADIWRGKIEDKAYQALKEWRLVA